MIVLCYSKLTDLVDGSGSVKVWDPRQKNKPVAVMEPAEGEARRDCWSVAFGNFTHVRNINFRHLFFNIQIKTLNTKVNISLHVSKLYAI